MIITMATRLNPHDGRKATRWSPVSYQCQYVTRLHTKRPETIFTVVGAVGQLLLTHQEGA